MRRVGRVGIAVRRGERAAGRVAGGQARSGIGIGMVAAMPFAVVRLCGGAVRRGGRLPVRHAHGHLRRHGRAHEAAQGHEHDQGKEDDGAAHGRQ
ncbi:hypothetical protein ACAN107058_23585 [Paracidovorax anthurii]